MPAHKKALSPASRAKADKRNGRDKAKRAAKAAASGGTKSGKKRKATPDLAEEEMTSSGGSWERSGELLFALLEEKQERHFEAGKLELAEEKSRGYERFLGLQDEYVKFLEWSDAEKAKKIEVLEKEKEELEKKYQDVLDLNGKEYDEAQQEVDEHQKAHFTCWFHYLDLMHLCHGKFMTTLQEPINHTKLLRQSGYTFTHFV